MTEDSWMGLVGGLVGGGIGLAGGIWGTWNSIRNTRGPRERAFVKRASVWAWVLCTGFLAGLFLIPKPWGWMIWLAYGPVMAWGIRAANAGQVRARSADGSLPVEPGVEQGAEPGGAVRP